MKVRISRAAERDLEEIGDWIARDDQDAAGRFTAELAAKAGQIAAMPLGFPAVEGADGSLRKRSHRRYIIYYRVGRTSVTVIRVLFHSRDLSAQLRKS